MLKALSLLLIISFSAAAKTSNPWTGVKLNVSLFSEAAFDAREKEGEHKLIPNVGCFLTPEQFYACLQAVRAAGSLSVPVMSLVPSQDLSREEWRGFKKISSSGDLVLVGEQRIVADEDPKAGVDRIQREYKDILAMGARLIDGIGDFHSLPIDFDKILRKILAKKQKNISEAQFTAVVANAFAVALDAHAHIDLKSIFDKVSRDENSFVGIGVTLRKEGGRLVLIHPPNPESPAAQADLRVGDIILRVDGKDIRPLPQSAIFTLMDGNVGKPMRLTVQREKDVFEVRLIRRKLKRKYVDKQIFEDMITNGKPLAVGYVRLETFAISNACEQMRGAIFELEGQGAEALILDLRGNEGGFFDQAICVAALFAGRQPLVYSKKLVDGTFTTAMGKEAAVTQKPLVVLTNARSASASEMVAGSLQGLELAFIVGERTYGKGTSQTEKPLPIDKDEFYYFETKDRFYVPYRYPATGERRMRSNQRIGVKPDFEVYARPGIDEPYHPREGDSLPHALPAEETEWVQVRAEEVESIKACLATAQRAESVFNSSPGRDYQLLKAEEVLACQLQSR
jgi:C-terminal peptidase prc